MKIFQLSILSAPLNESATQLAAASALASFSFFQRGAVQEFMTFFSKTLAERTSIGRQSVEEKEYTFHVYKKEGPQQLTAILICDNEYPVRPAYSLLTKALEDFTSKVPESSYSDPSSISFPEIDGYVTKYQDPHQADTIMRVQAELDETKIVLHQTIESVLQRGEKLDNLVDRSNALSAQSKMFYKTAKSQNSCCTIM